MKPIMKPPKFSQQGFTMIELMIAGFLGLLLTVGMMQVFISSATTSKLNLALTRVQENGQLAVTVLEKAIQRAGWTDQDKFPASFYTLDNNILFPGQTDASGEAVSFGSVNNKVSDAEGNSYTVLEPSDSLTVQFHGTVDCLGKEVNEGEVGLVINHYYLSEKNGLPELFCRGNGGDSGDVIVSNVESLQLLYGVDVTGDGSSVQYFNAEDIANNEVAPDEAVSKITTVKLALLVRSELNALDNEQATFTVLDQAGKKAFYDDRRLRRVFSKTVYVPNKTY